MKRIHIKTLIGTALMTSFLMGCSDVLDETPRSTYTPEYFKTTNGVMGGLTGMYAHLRYIYGGYYYAGCQSGTDETTYGQNASTGFLDNDLSGVGTLTPTSSQANGLWAQSFYNINSASGIIENGSEAGVSNALIAEARFFRAFDYFNLVQTFGGVPLDLGSGELKFNISASRKSVRNTVPEVYTKAVFPDLLTAINDLPDAGRVTGGATKTLARLYLSKAYLTYGWWLENPNNIPTYPTCDRTDPDGHNAAWYFQQAYNVATTAIANPGPFALQATYYDVNLATNDRNSEILLYADHTQNETYNQTSLTYSTGSSPENFASWLTQWNYPLIKSSSKSTTWTGVFSLWREAAQALGRPWTSMAPPIGVFTNTFADKTNDSRYDGTFTSVYRGNWNRTGTGLTTTTTLYNANNMPVAPGDAILSFLDDEPTTAVTYPSGVLGNSNVGAGVLPGRADWVIAPSGISRISFPGLWKLGPYRTDNGTGLGSPNGASTRPFNVAKFSELYFIAAEAAVKGANTAVGQSARELINVIRARAGKWRWSNNGNVNKVADHSVAMTAATPVTIDINYILAERSREYFGEGYRWNDLVRTQKLAELAGTYQICDIYFWSHTPLTVKRTIPNTYYLRPIPLDGQIKALEMTNEEKAVYQNPGY
jgi:starch-binding outer membrane protein, SusD/RagB family